MGKKCLAIKESTKSEEVASRLAYDNDEKDAFAQNITYHINCQEKIRAPPHLLLTAVRKTKTLSRQCVI